jgi:DNA-binding response OmpR family regulator
LVKPFELQELMMRIQALVKRSTVSDIVRRRDIEIDMERNVITKGGTVVDITLKEWQVL